LTSREDGVGWTASMNTDEDRMREAAERSEILRAPQQSLFTFGSTSIYYYLVTEPVYADTDAGATTETVVREGRVLAERPKIVTPHYLYSIEGFSDDARRYFDALMGSYGPNIQGLLYSYKNEPKNLNIVSDHWRTVVDRLNADIDSRGDPLVTIIKGQDELWDVALIKFIFDMTRRSVGHNLGQMESRGLLGVDSGGIPADARHRIEEMFRQVSRGEIAAGALKDELDRWGLFDEYEDRFLGIFGK
jgi:hypothetical protein